MVGNIITVTLNPAIDATIMLDGSDFSEPLNCVDRHDYPGGKGINVSRVLTALSVENIPLCVVGKENAEDFERLLKKDGVHAELFKNSGKIRENLTIVFNDSRVLKINFKGFEMEMQNFASLKKRLVELLKANKNSLVVFAGSLPEKMSAENYFSLVSLCEEYGGRAALDNAFFSAEDISKIRPFIIKPNHIELAAIFGYKSLDEKGIIDCAVTLAKNVENVLVSMGEKGLLGVCGENIFLAEPPLVEVKSTVGAGDSTLAGFCAAIKNEIPFEAALKFAAACGTASVMLDGTEAINLAQAHEMLKRVSSKQLN